MRATTFIIKTPAEAAIYAEDGYGGVLLLNMQADCPKCGRYTKEYIQPLFRKITKSTLITTKLPRKQIVCSGYCTKREQCVYRQCFNDLRK